MKTAAHDSVSIDKLIAAMHDPAVYPGAANDPVVVHETHISWVFLVGDVAYKLKKPVKTSFLDYSTLEKRRHFCNEEIRLDRRYAPELYLDVVPIVWTNDRASVEGPGTPVEYAVKMKRFADDALLSHRVETGSITRDEVLDLARRLASFHQNAARLDLSANESSFGSPATIYRDAIENLDALRESATGETAKTVRILYEWTDEFFSHHEREFLQRRANGFVRECHGDLHLGNVIHWNDRLVPFDGIEFNDRFRWIDVISDAAFTTMDFAAFGRLDLSRSFINAYLEQTGDHASLPMLRWYLVFRALVRAKVDAIRAGQDDASPQERDDALTRSAEHVELAYQFSLCKENGLWITHGVSGSGKTTVSELIVQRHGAIRLRSDLERKRHFGLTPTQRPTEAQKADLYCAEGARACYSRLLRMGRGLLRAGFPVVVDATFLRRDDREQFRQLADQEGVPFGIVDCHAETSTLRQRIADRIARDDDASDADLQVLNQQLSTREPLTAAERMNVIEIPDLSLLLN